MEVSKVEANMQKRRRQTDETVTPPDGQPPLKKQLSSDKPEDAIPEDEPMKDATPSPKRKATVTNPPLVQEGRNNALARRQGVIAVRVARTQPMANPTPIVYITVELENYNNYFASLYRSLIRVTYQGGPLPNNLLTEANFQLVCRYLMKARVDLVYSSQSGRRAPHRVPIPRNVLIPKALSDIINAIGPIAVSLGTWIVVPQPPNEGNDQTATLLNRVTHAILEAFSNLIQTAVAFAHIRVAPIGSHSSGTAFWLLRACTPNNATAGGNAQRVIIRSAFRNFTPADALLAAIVQNQFNGILPTVTNMCWTHPAIVDVMNIRDQFNLNA